MSRESVELVRVETGAIAFNMGKAKITRTIQEAAGERRIQDIELPLAQIINEKANVQNRIDQLKEQYVTVLADLNELKAQWQAIEDEVTANQEV